MLSYHSSLYVPQKVLHMALSLLDIHSEEEQWRWTFFFDKLLM